MSQNTAKHIDNLYRNARQMTAFTVIGLIVPIILLIASVLGIVYHFQKNQLLQQIDSGQIRLSGPEFQAGSPTVAEKVAYLRENSNRLLMPVITLGIAIVALAGVGVLMGVTGAF